MTAWDDRLGTSPVAGAGGSRTFSSSGGVGMPGGSGGIYHPTPAGQPAGVPNQNDEQPPGVVSINPFDPVGSAMANKDPLSALFSGLRTGLFGTDAPDAEGKHGGLLGDIPVYGDVARAGTGAAAGAVGALQSVPGHVADVAGGVLERIGGDNKDLQAAYDAIPEDFKKPYQDAINREHGVFGTGLLDDDAHFKYRAVKEYTKAQIGKGESTDIFKGELTAPGSLSDALNFLFNIPLSASSALGARAEVGLATPGQGDMKRIDLIKAVGDGRAAFNADKGILGTGLAAGDPTTGLNEVEQIAYDKVTNGTWTDTEAEDFLVAAEQSFGHSALINIGGAVAFDPVNLAAGGAGLAAKAGSKGLKVLNAVQKAEKALGEANAAVRMAQSNLEAAKLVGGAAEKEAGSMLEHIAGRARDIEESLASLNEWHSGTSVRRANLLARAIEGRSGGVGTMKAIGKVYGTLESVPSLGRAAKVSRTIIDPLHAIDLRMPGSARMVDLTSDAVPASIADTLGVQHYKGIEDDILRNAPAGVHDDFVKDFAVASTNVAREGIVDLARAGQIAGGLGEELLKTSPGELLDTAVQSMKERDLRKYLRQVATVHVDKMYTEADKATLARKLSHVYSYRSEAEWAKYLATASKEQASILDFASYGALNSRLLDFAATAENAAGLPIERLVLVAKGTLTRQGADGLLTRLTKLKKTQRKVDLIREWQDQYPVLRYISIDPNAKERSVDRFIQHLEQNMDRYPSQLKNDEIAQLGDEAESLLEATGGTYSLGFRPEDRFLWGMERDAGDGLYRPVTQAWVDHVGKGEAAAGYRPAQAVRLNIAGHPLVDVPVLNKGIRAVDHMDSAFRVMKQQVSAAQVSEGARKRFTFIAGQRFAEHGVTPQIADDWFNRLTEYTREHQGYSGPRGMAGGDLFKALKEEKLIPQPLLNGSRRLSPDDVMRLVLEAYDGDMRYIGLTQKLSGRAKRVLFEMTGSNWAGQIAEHAWPTMKFRYNPIFQLQEKIEPWVLNAQRGVSFATGVEMTDADRATEALLERMTDYSLVRQADLDQFEYSSQVLFGGLLQKASKTPGTQLNRMQRVARGITEVQGMKRVNMLRTFRKGLGKELKSVWEETQPGVWQDMKDAADLRAGRVLDEDDFALQLVSEQQFSNDIIVNRLGRAGGRTQMKADWGNAIKTGAWYTPANIGELKALDLEHVASSLGLAGEGGRDIKDLKDLRQALATGTRTLDDVEDALKRGYGADPDYIRRVRNALDFSWTGFWATAEKRFALTPDESFRLQNMFAQTAQLRGMTPVEYMSQVFAPGILHGEEGILGHIEGTVRTLREARAAGRGIKPRQAKIAEFRTQLAGKEGVSTRDDLVRQLSRGFAANLDPSAKKRLLMEMRPELRQGVLDGRLRFDLQELEDMWDENADNELANRILGYMDGKEPTAPFKAVTDADRGVAEVRDAADKYITKRGVTPRAERRYYDIDEAHYEATAKAYGKLPVVEYDRTGRIPNITHLQKSGTELKPALPGVDDATYDSYQDFVMENANQFDYITRAKSKGGMGIKVSVTKGDPYPNSAAMRADLAKGRLKVFGGDSDHPIMTNEQNVIFRAVHDVFGHGAEGFEFGPQGELNAAIHHSRMYSDTSFGALMSETHGQTAYNNYSDDVIKDASTPFEVDPASPISSFAKQFAPDDPYDTDVVSYGKDMEGLSDPTKPDVPLELTFPNLVGIDMSELDPEQQHFILQNFATLFEQFPEYRPKHIDVYWGMHEPAGKGLTGLGLDRGVKGVTYGGGHGEPVIFLSPLEYEDNFEKAKAKAIKAADDVRFAQFRRNFKTGVAEKRNTPRGVPGNLIYGQKSTIVHEFGHNVDLELRGGPFWPLKKLDHPEYFDFVKEFDGHPASRLLSEYAKSEDPEMMAELFSFTFGMDDADRAMHIKLIKEARKRMEASGVDLTGESIPEEDYDALLDFSNRYRKLLEDMDVFKPTAGGGKYSHLAGRTVRDVNAAKRGSYYGPQRAGLLPNAVLEEFGTKFRGVGKHVESSPDVARAAQMFGKWSENAIFNGLLKGEDAVHAGLLADIKAIPTASAVPFDHTEAATVNLATQSMVRKWDDAFRLQYFAQERSMLERTVNHPMFGIYPASYMWGKIMPEVVKAVAFEPFGMKTGGLLYGLQDAQAAIAMRREYDADFDASMEKVGHSQALSFAGYMLPTIPWDISASAPAWMRSIAEQGAQQADEQAAGGNIESGISLLDPAKAALDRLNPLTTTIPWGGRAVGETQTFIGNATQADTSPGGSTVLATELAPAVEPNVDELQKVLLGK